MPGGASGAPIRTNAIDLTPYRLTAEPYYHPAGHEIALYEHAYAHRLPLDKKGEIVAAHPDLQLVVSYSPGYQSHSKSLKQSTRQRFAALARSCAELIDGR